MDVFAGAGVRVSMDDNAPGVRKTLIQAGLVRMAGSRGSTKLTGRLVRKSLLGLRRDLIFVSSLQLEAKRSAHPLVIMIQKNPNSRIRIMRMAESRRSYSRVFMETSVHRETHIYGGTRVSLFVVACAFDPNTTVVCVDNTTRNGKAKSGTAAFEFCFAR